MASSSNTVKNQKTVAIQTVPINQMSTMEQTSGNSKMQLLDLNHYALLKVCQSIKNFKDQLAFAQTCDQICQIFTNHIWNRGEPVCEISPSNDIGNDTQESSDYQFFLQAMHTRFTHFYAHEIEHLPGGLTGVIDLLKRFGIYKMPKVKMCILRGTGGMVETDIIELREMLPNLKSLLLYTVPIKGQYLMELKNLEELFVIDMPIEGEHLKNVIRTLPKLRVLDARSCNNLRLKEIKSDSLEVVRLHAHTIRSTLLQILQLPKLKTLELRYCEPHPQSENNVSHHGFYPFRFLLPTILTQKAVQITGIKINNKAMQLPADWDNQLDTMNLCNLQKLIFNNWQHDEIFMARHIPNKSNVKTFSCGDWSKLTHKRIIDILASFKNLKIFEFSKYKLDHNTLCRMAETLKYEGRIDPLDIWNWSQIKNTLSKEQIEFWTKQKLLKLHFTPATAPDLREFRRDIYGFEIEFDNSL